MPLLSPLLEDPIEGTGLEALEWRHRNTIVLQEFLCLFNWVRFDVHHLFYSSIDNVTRALEAGERRHVNGRPLRSAVTQRSNRSLFRMDCCAQLHVAAWKKPKSQINSAVLALPLR